MDNTRKEKITQVKKRENCVTHIVCRWWFSVLLPTQVVTSTNWTNCTVIVSVASRQHLCSASRGLLVVPRHRLSSYGRRAFSVAGPAIWNGLSDSLIVPLSVLINMYCNLFSLNIRKKIFVSMWEQSSHWDRLLAASYSYSIIRADLYAGFCKILLSHLFTFYSSLPFIIFYFSPSLCSCSPSSKASCDCRLNARLRVAKFFHQICGGPASPLQNQAMPVMLTRPQPPWPRPRPHTWRPRTYLVSTAFILDN